MLNNQVFTSSRKSVSVHKWLWSPSHVSMCCLASGREPWELILAVKTALGSARNFPKLSEFHQLTTACKAQDAFLQEPHKEEFWMSKGVIFPFITPVTHPNHTLSSTWHRCQGTSHNSWDSQRISLFYFKFQPAKNIGFWRWKTRSYVANPDLEICNTK